MVATPKGLSRPEKTDEIRQFLNGTRLYGDDFSPEEVERWYADEREAYFNLVKQPVHGGPQTYGYHTLNREYGFRHLHSGRFSNVLGLGSAWGAEFEPIIDRIDRLTILEPSGGFVRDEIHGVPVTYLEPNASGKFPFESDQFDLITCLGVLHHIPNVHTVVTELFRCLTRGGHVLIREPTISMGDWRYPRSGLTPHERGIPLKILRRIIEDVGFEVLVERRCMFQLMYNLEPFFPGSVWNSRLALELDRAFCILFARNASYHPLNRLQNLRPTAVYYVLRKGSPGGR